MTKRTASILLVALLVFCYFEGYSQSAKTDRSKPGGSSAARTRPWDGKISSFRYIIFVNYVQGEEDETDPDAFQLRRVETLMEANAFNQENLILLFKLLSKRFPKPSRLTIKVHTSLLTIETPEENEAISDHTSRESYENYHKTADYSRFDDGNEVFLYATGNPPSFVWETIMLPPRK